MQLSSVQGHRTTGGGSETVDMSSSGLPAAASALRMCDVCRDLWFRSSLPQFQKATGKQSKGKNLVANDRASRIRPIFASQARLSFFPFTSKRPDQFVL